ncbi:hypothetical protein [Thalassospira alkalitolerans]|uniref:hypothetical protein n=1 Tax=Thalassospira alkalitolerans TaxID=1293890 RepID=UPI003AA85E41
MSALGLKEYPSLLTQAECLADYIGRHGYVLGAVPTEAANRAEIYKRLLALIADAQTAGSVDPKLEQDLRSTYQETTAFIFPEKNLNGLTIWESAQTRVKDEGKQTHKSKAKRWFLRFFEPYNLPLVMGFIILVALFLIIILSTHAGCTADGTNDPAGWIWLCAIDQYLIPMGWGAIGTTVYVLKRTTDARNNETYSRFRLSGYSTRVFLGAMFGLIIVELIPSLGDGAGNFANASVAVIAFVAGLGIKPVYAAFEQLAIQISDRITGKKTDPK